MALAAVELRKGSADAVLATAFADRLAHATVALLDDLADGRRPADRARYVEDQHAPPLMPERRRRDIEAEMDQVRAQVADVLDRERDDLRDRTAGRVVTDKLAPPVSRRIAAITDLLNKAASGREDEHARS